MAPEVLGHVVLWPSHILIRHSGSSALVPFDPSWRGLPKPPVRSWEEASALAERIAKAAAAAPEQFAWFAARYSEDVTSSREGGAIGPITAWDLRPYPEVLDALAALPVGTVSSALETEHGFHIFYRNAPPPSHLVEGRRRVFHYSYDERGEARDEALAAAKRALAEIRLVPNGRWRDFGDDVGQWSTTEPSSLGRIISALDRVPVGSFTDPVDSRDGWQILWRAPLRSRTRYAMTTIRIDYDEKAPAGSAFSKRSTLKTLQQISGALQLDPSQFEHFQELYCCKDLVPLWTEGQVSVQQTELVSHLSIGEISGPVELEGTMVIAKRVDPATVPQEPTLYDLPSPHSLDLAALAKAYSGSAVQSLVRDVRDTAVRELSLAGPREEAFNAATKRLEVLFGTTGISPSERLAEYEAVTTQLKEVLGATEFDVYTRICERMVTTFLLQPQVRRDPMSLSRRQRSEAASTRVSQ